MSLTLDPANVKALRQEAGEPTTYAIVQDDGELLVRVGGVTLGVPVEVDGKLVFDHDFPGDAIAVLTSRAATRAVVVGDATAASLDDSAFAEWRSGMKLAVGDVLRHEGIAYEVIQAHTTQADWAPPIAPALFKAFRDPVGAPAAWVQPAGAHDAYNTGDRVTFQGSVYESLINANVWSPTAYPQGWTLIP
jgi:hypothetical protein